MFERLGVSAYHNEFVRMELGAELAVGGGVGVEEGVGHLGHPGALAGGGAGPVELGARKDADGDIVDDGWILRAMEVYRQNDGGARGGHEQQR